MVNRIISVPPAKADGPLQLTLIMCCDGSVRPVNLYLAAATYTCRVIRRTGGLSQHLVCGGTYKYFFVKEVVFEREISVRGMELHNVVCPGNEQTKGRHPQSGGHDPLIYLKTPFLTLILAGKRGEKGVSRAKRGNTCPRAPPLDPPLLMASGDL